MANLDHLVQSSKLFIDTCSIVHESAERFSYLKLRPALLKYGKRVIIPKKVIDEVKRLKCKGKNIKVRAERALKIIRSFHRSQLIDIRGETNDPFADSLFQYVFTKFRTRYNLALLTQDRRLAGDILRIKNSRSAKSVKTIQALYLGMDGKVHDWQKGQPYQGSVLPKTKNRFKICTNPIQGGGKLLPVSVIPQQGDFVKTSNFGQLQLEKKIGEGGEGKIFTTPRGSICKVYLKSKLTEHRVNKLQLMLSKPVDIPGICWPLDIIHNQNDEPVGYMMPKAEGLPIQQAVFIRAIFEKSFPNWNRRHLVAFTRTFLERIKTLQDRNVLIGDLNPMNILIKSESEVYFVDTDSYQLEMFPCPVGMAHFTAPEIQGKNYSTFLRTPEHEHFALATMLFMILLPGKPPYSHQGGGNPAGNIKKGLFPYPFEENSKRKAPIGSWRYIWSNLPYKTKEAFYNCFTSGKRPTTDEWLHLIRHYQTTLLHGHLTNEIFPSSLKPVSNHAQQTFGVSATKYIKFACEACGQDFTMLEEKAQKIQKVKKKLCRKCFEKKKREAEQRRIDQETGDMIVCNRCFDSFLFSLGEKKFYSKNGYVPPKYCKKCREKRKFDPARPQLFKPKTFRLQPLLHNFYQRSKRKISYPNSLILPYRSRKPRIL